MKKFYLRRVLIPDEKVSGELLEEKLGIFEGTLKDMKKDRDYWTKEKGAVKVRYFKLREIANPEMLINLYGQNQ